MYLPPAFREEDLPTLHAAMRAARIVNLVTATADGLVASPLPLLLAADEGPFGTLYGHLARANPQWKSPAAELNVGLRQSSSPRHRRGGPFHCRASQRHSALSCTD